MDSWIVRLSQVPWAVPAWGHSTSAVRWWLEVEEQGDWRVLGLDGASLYFHGASRLSVWFLFFKYPHKETFIRHQPWTKKRTSLVAQTVKRLPTVQESRVQSLGQEDPLEKEMAPHSSTLAWKIQWMEESGRLQSMASQRVGHDWATSHTCIHGPKTVVNKSADTDIQFSL